jgi:hypothetical protein
MRKKPDDNSRDPADADTRSFQQRMGGKDKGPAPRSERMPHERDESARATGDRLGENPVPSDRQITQANEDVENGQVDTDRRGVPSDVPHRKR